MPPLVLAVPVQPGKAEHLHDFFEEMIHGESHDAKHDHLKEVGLTDVQVYLQKTPVEMLIFSMDGPEVHNILDRPHSSDHELDQELYQLLEMVSGYHPKQWQAPQMLVNWHHQEGHRHKPARRAS